MKKRMGLSLLSAALLFTTGCLVRSVQPWLSDETRVQEPSLIGTWHNTNGASVAFFTGTPEEYHILSVDDGKDVSRFTATLHRLDDTLLLMVGPEDPDNLNGYALLPGHLLLQAVLDGDSLKLHGIDLESFADRAAKAPLALLPGGSENDGYVLTGTSADAEAFVRAQLADPEFFDEKPLYSFQKLPAATD